MCVTRPYIVCWNEWNSFCFLFLWGGGVTCPRSILFSPPPLTLIWIDNKKGFRAQPNQISLNDNGGLFMFLSCHKHIWSWAFPVWTRKKLVEWFWLDLLDPHTFPVSELQSGYMNKLVEDILSGSRKLAATVNMKTQSGNVPPRDQSSSQRWLTTRGMKKTQRDEEEPVHPPQPPPPCRDGESCRWWSTVNTQCGVKVTLLVHWVMKWSQLWDWIPAGRAGGINKVKKPSL